MDPAAQQRSRPIHWVGCFICAMLLVVGCAGCVVLAPVIDGVRQTGVTESDRQRLLTEEVKKYYDALYWGNPSVATTFASDRGREEIAQYMKNRDRNERLVESKVESVNFTNDSYAAEVEITERFYKVPYYMVNSRLQHQEWEFSLLSGWKIVSQKVDESPSVTKAG